MKYPVLFYLTLFLFIFSSCKKKELIYEFSGTIKDISSKNEINSVKLSFYQKKFNQTALNENFIYIGETKTNGQGNYTFSFKREKILEVKIILEHQNYYQKEVIILSDDLSPNKVNFFDSFLYPKAWLKLNIKSTPPHANKQLNLYKHNIKEDCLDCCVNGLTSYIGETNTSVVCPVNGRSKTKISWGEVTISSSFSDSIYCPSFDTTSFDIQY